MNDLSLLLQCGGVIPFAEAQVNIYQPTIAEIGFIGEKAFYSGCGILTFSKDSLSLEDKQRLEHMSDFEVLMLLLTDKNHEAQRNKIQALMVLSLIFPDYSINFTPQSIILKKEDEIHLIDTDNFHKFKEILSTMFCLKGRGEDNQNYNPANEQARKIAEKLLQGRQKAAAAKGEEKGGGILARLVSILAIGLKMDMNVISNYTVFQLFDQYDRFELYEANEMQFRARLAGARDLEEIDNWRKDFHSK